jgi:hypothetical protein
MSKTDLMPTPRINPLGHMAESKDVIQVPAHMIPAFNVWKAFEEGKNRKFLINTWGGLGDQICSEPAIRYALKNFNKCEISLASRTPSIFSHLSFKETFDTREPENFPVWNDYLVFQTIVNPDYLIWQFASHMLTHCVDFPALCMWRATLPIADKEIILPDFEMTEQVRSALNEKEKTIVLHPGRHWPSKTFPESWWNSQIKAFQDRGFKICLIGAKVDENVGYADVDATGCIDLRDKLSIPEYVSILKNCAYLFSNDSSPIHAAAAGDAFIGFVASVKHPDYITHWRKGQWGYKTKSFELDGPWNHIDQNPVQKNEVKIEKLPDGLMEKLLPNPEDVAAFYAGLRG